MYLVGDIGGTKTHLAIFSPENGPRDTLADARFPSADYPDLETIVEEFLRQAKITVEKAAFAVAGPVVGGKAKLTNLPWLIDEKELCSNLKFSTAILMNDLVGISVSVPHLTGEDIHTLNEGKPVEKGAIAVIAPGTGLGEGFLTWDGYGYRAYPSEGGHTDFAPVDEFQAGLLRFLQKRFGHVSYERVCSGEGVSTIYEYLKVSGYSDEPEWLTKELSAADDPAPVITRAALNEERTCDLCIETMRIIVSVLGAQAGNLALSVLATGGVYIGGGIAPKILSILDRGGFMEAFTDKGRMSSLLSAIPVKVITNPNPALLGAAYRLIEDQN